MTISLSLLETLFLCCLVLILGRFLTSKINFLAKYSIPDPIVGGLLFAFALTFISKFTGVQLSLNTEMRTTLLLLFFSAIGLTTNLGLLAKGGPLLLRFIIVLAPFLFIQNFVGLGLAWAFDMHPLVGLLGGTITLVGGHGTGAAYANEFMEVFNIQDVMALAMTSATMGLILGGIIGGPVAERLIKRFKLSNPLVSDTPTAEASTQHESLVRVFTSSEFIVSLAFASGVLVAGLYADDLVKDLLKNSSISVPTFLLCMLIGIIVRNGGSLIGLRLSDKMTELLGSVALSLFLGMTMMTLDLNSIVRLAGPLVVILAVQVLVCAVYASFIVFRVLKGDYEAVVMAAAFCGFAMGATATAIANMQALTKRHGPAPQSFIVVPITGAFIVDILNVLTLTTLMSLPFVVA